MHPLPLQVSIREPSLIPLSYELVLAGNGMAGRWDSREVGLEAWKSRRVLGSLGFSSQEEGACPSRLHTSRLSPAFSFRQEPCGCTTR